MFTRLPDFTFTDNPMYGNAPVKPENETSPTFYQGDDIELAIYLKINDTPLSLAYYRLEFVVKKAESASNVIYRTTTYNKPDNAPEGYFVVLIPKQASSLLAQGTYYYSFTAVNLATGYSSMICKGTFNIEISTASPNPNLTIADGELTASGDSHNVGMLISPAEITEPHSPDIASLTF